MSEIFCAPPPLLIHDVIQELDAVRRLLEQNAPYTPLGGWYRPGADPNEASSAMWFQQDWVHADYAAEGSDLFLHCERYYAAAKEYYGAECILPHSVYVNVMAGLEECGPAHTDNPKFRGRERKNTPMWLLRTMLWSGLFDRWEIVQATAIWWLNDVEEGGLSYWADGPDQPAHRHVGRMANSALVGDNHRMFHQVERVGPFGDVPKRVTARAELAPKGEDGSNIWCVKDRGTEVYCAALESFRVSVLWKADVYADENARKSVAGDLLSFEDVANIFNADLRTRDEGLRFDLDRLEDPEFAASLAAIYPEAKPMGARRSIYDT